MSTIRASLGLFSLLVVMVGVSATSRAQQCASNADCAKGLTCQTSAVPPSPPVADPACPKGTACDAPTTSTSPPAPASAPAPTVSQMTCQPAPCASNADCGSDMVCHTETIGSCSGGTTRACPPNTACEPVPVAPPVCTETKISSCVYRWQLPCSTDAECGANFVCMPSVIGSCSGSGGTPTPGTSGSGSSGSGSSSSGGGTASSTGGASSSTAPPAATRPPESTTTCTTTTTFPGYCQAKPITCGLDADCPSSWTCASVETTVSTPPSATGPGAVTGSGGSSGSGSGAVVRTNLPLVARIPTKLCQPPYRGYGFAQDVGVKGGTPEAGSPGGSTTGSGGVISGPTVPPSGGSVATGNGASTDSKPTVPPAGPTPVSSASPGVTRSADGGCSVAGSSGGANGSSLGLGLLLIVLASTLISRGRQADRTRLGRR